MSQPINHATDEPTLADQLEAARDAAAALETPKSDTAPEEPVVVVTDTANVEEHGVVPQQQHQQPSTGLMAGVKRQLATLKKDSSDVKKTEDKKENSLTANLRRKLTAGLEHLHVSSSSKAATSAETTTESQAIAAAAATATPLPPSMPETPPSQELQAPHVLQEEEKSSTPRDLIAKFRRRISGGNSGTSEVPVSESVTLSTDPPAQSDVQTVASAPAVIVPCTSALVTPPTTVVVVDEVHTSSSTPGGGASAAEKRKSMRASLTQSWRRFSDKDVRPSANPATPDAISKNEDKAFSLPFKRRRSASPPAAVKEAKISSTQEVHQPAAAAAQQSETAPVAAADIVEDKQQDAATPTTTEPSSSGGGALFNLLAGLRSKVTPLLSKDKSNTDPSAIRTTTTTTTRAEDKAKTTQPRRSFSVSDVKDRFFGAVQKQRPKSMHAGGGASEGTTPPLASELEPVQGVADIKESSLLVSKPVVEGDADATQLQRNRTKSQAETVKPDETSAVVVQAQEEPSEPATLAMQSQSQLQQLETLTVKSDDVDNHKPTTNTNTKTDNTQSLISPSAHSFDTQLAITADEANSAASSPTLASHALAP